MSRPSSAVRRGGHLRKPHIFLHPIWRLWIVSYMGHSTDPSFQFAALRFAEGRNYYEGRVRGAAK